MNKTKVKIPAKINLTLDVVGKDQNFHNLNSLVASINLYDAITLRKNKSKKITLIEKGIKAGCEKDENNAVKTAKLVLEKYADFGLDIAIKKCIPVGAGLGGSSADVAGVLVGCDMFLDGTLDLYNLAKSLGSDVNYMLLGGFAVISGKGDEVKSINTDQTLYLIIITEDKCITSKECFKKFDELNVKDTPVTEKAVKLLSTDVSEFLKTLKNDLYLPATYVMPKIKENYNLLKSFGPAVMTGSGTAVLGVYEDRKTRNKVAKALNRRKIKFIKAKTI